MSSFPKGKQPLQTTLSRARLLAGLFVRVKLQYTKNSVLVTMLGGSLSTSVPSKSDPEARSTRRPTLAAKSDTLFESLTLSVACPPLRGFTFKCYYGQVTPTMRTMVVQLYYITHKLL